VLWYFALNGQIAVDVYTMGVESKSIKLDNTYVADGLEQDRDTARFGVSTLVDGKEGPISFSR
jgi:hypothetical protein